MHLVHGERRKPIFSKARHSLAICVPMPYDTAEGAKDPSSRPRRFSFCCFVGKIACLSVKLVQFVVCFHVLMVVVACWAPDVSRWNTLRCQSLQGYTRSRLQAYRGELLIVLLLLRGCTWHRVVYRTHAYLKGTAGFVSVVSWMWAMCRLDHTGPFVPQSCRVVLLFLNAWCVQSSYNVSGPVNENDVGKHLVV